MQTELDFWKRKLKIMGSFILLCFFTVCFMAPSISAEEKPAAVERWGIFELSLKGPEEGNPFLDVELSAQFMYKNRVVKTYGFYDGDGVYRIRFMPDTLGEWHYATKSNIKKLDGKKGIFTCVEPSPGNHGLVSVRNNYHFAYADGTPYLPFGTTCYAWIHQGNKLEEQTLKTLSISPFNKLRMCVFPKDYVYNKNEPEYYPFEGSPMKNWDFTRFNSEFFRHLEQRVADLCELGIEADIILFHPYDRWGFSSMNAENDYCYLKYIIARLSAYRNVWWSMANEYDFLLRRKPMSQWDRFFQIVQENDPYGHLRSIHNGNVDMNYDHTKPWITHVCIQNWDVKKAKEWRNTYKKPIIDDECEYEGNVPLPWGNISAKELVHRFWIMLACGCYAGHGETYENPENILWWSKGGVLVGESWKRIAFLKKIMEEGSAEGLEPMGNSWVWSRVTGGMKDDYRLFYFGEHQPLRWSIGLPEKGKYKIDVIDTWNMTITPLEKMYEGKYEVPLPGKPYIALRVRKIK